MKNVSDKVIEVMKANVKESDKEEIVSMSERLVTGVNNYSNREIQTSENIIDFDGAFVVINLQFVNTKTKFSDWYCFILGMKQMTGVMFRVKWDDHQEYLV